MYLNTDEILGLSFNIGDGLQFFFEKMCFGEGCALGCPNKMDKPFLKSENETRIQIINSEFDGLFEACVSRQDCLSHDVLNYVASDTIQDYYNYDKNIILDEKDREFLKLADIIKHFVVNFTNTNGSTILKKPTASASEYFGNEST